MHRISPASFISASARCCFSQDKVTFKINEVNMERIFYMYLYKEQQMKMKRKLYLCVYQKLKEGKTFMSLARICVFVCVPMCHVAGCNLRNLLLVDCFPGGKESCCYYFYILVPQKEENSCSFFL